jgi:hypothetical protein
MAIDAHYTTEENISRQQSNGRTVCNVRYELIRTVWSRNGFIVIKTATISLARNPEIEASLTPRVSKPEPPSVFSVILDFPVYIARNLCFRVAVNS